MKQVIQYEGKREFWTINDDGPKLSLALTRSEVLWCLLVRRRKKFPPLKKGEKMKAFLVIKGKTKTVFFYFFLSRCALNRVS